MKSALEYRALSSQHKKKKFKSETGYGEGGRLAFLDEQFDIIKGISQGSFFILSFLQ
jgi:hypothetical protein